MKVDNFVAKAFTWSLVSCSLILILIGCQKKGDPLPVYGTILWKVDNSSFKADSFAVASTDVGSNGGPATTIYGIASKGNILQIDINPLQAPGTFTAGGLQLPLIQYGYPEKYSRSMGHLT